MAGSSRSWFRVVAVLVLGAATATACHASPRNRTSPATLSGSVVPVSPAADVVPPQAWSVRVGGEPSAPVVRGRVAFVASTGVLTVVDLRDGTIAWTAKVPRSSCDRPAVVRRVVVVSCGEWVVAFGALTGHELWRKPILTWTFSGGVERRAIGPPTATADLVFVQDVTQGISAIEPRSGRVVWSHALAGTSSEPATASDGIVYVPSGTSAGPPSGMLWGTVVQAIDARTGTVRWTAPTKGDILSPPVLDAGRLFVSTESGGPSFAIDGRTGEIVHRFPRYGLQFPAGAGRLVVAGVGVGDGHQRVAAIDASTGDRLWATPTPNGLSIQTPTVIDGTAYIASNQGGDLLYAFDLATGKREWKVHLNSVSGTAAGPGEQLLVTAGHKLIAYGLS